MRVNNKDIVPGISAEQVDQARWSWDFLESHAPPGVVLCGLSIVHEGDNKQKKKDRPSEQVEIVTQTRRNRPSEQAES
jgi:hypothetical protein